MKNEYTESSMVKKRLVWADSLKGILIILVVLGHAIQLTLRSDCYTNHMWNLIYSFHMPSFMAISGFLAYRPNDPIGKLNIHKYCVILWRRFRQLMIPFFLWTFAILSINRSVSYDQIRLHILYPDNGLWFLWALFFINVLFILGNLIADFIKVKQEFINLLFCVLLVLVMVRFELRVFSFQFISYYFIFYVLGYYLHKYYNVAIITKIYIIIPLSILWFILAWFWSMHETPIVINWLPLPEMILQYSYRFITAAIAIYLLLSLSPIFIDGVNIINKQLAYIGKISLGIYCVHFTVLGYFGGQLFKLGLDKIEIIFLLFIISLLLSSQIVRILNKWKVTSICLLGKV